MYYNKITVEIITFIVHFRQVYGRFEGFEHYVESIFGPRGNYSAKNVKHKLSKLRWPRSAIVKENDILKSQIDELPDMLENKFGAPKVLNTNVQRIYVTINYYFNNRCRWE